MQAILTRYIGPTDTRGSYVLARCDAKAIKVPWDYAKDPTDNHDAACAALVKVLGWDGTWVGGTLPQKGTKWFRAYVQVTP